VGWQTIRSRSAVVKNVENITCSRLCRIGRDWAAIPRLGHATLGKARVTVTDQPLDFDGNASGDQRL
jgi:hypothetical protein